MQKKLIALAVAGLASTAAFAQTNVVIYGVADGTFDVVESRDSTISTNATNSFTGAPFNAFRTPVLGLPTSQTSSNNSFGAFNRVSANSSYVGFKGSEDLGNGLKAIFQYESSIDFTAGSGTLAGRDSFVGLTGGFGTIVLGNLTGPSRALTNALDVNPGNTGIGSMHGITGKIAGNTMNFASLGNTATSNNGYCVNKGQTCASIFDTRWQNAVAYVSPNFGGFSGTAVYVANENRSNQAAQGAWPVNSLGYGGVIGSPSQLNTWGTDVGAKWEGGGFMAALTWNYMEWGNTTNTNTQNLRLGGMYTGTWGSVRAMWEQTNADNLPVFTQLGNANSSTDQQKFGIGGTFNLGKGEITAQWYGSNNAKNTNDTAANLYSVGYNYNLSKRTQLKFVYAMIDNDSNSAADFGVNSVGIGAGSGISSAAVGGVPVTFNTVGGSGASVQGVQMGIRHSF